MTALRRLAPYATRAEASRGRLYPEPESHTRSVFQRDRDRVIHSTAFRRLKHKTQVFVYDEGDHYRTRLTHSLEVAQIARSMARALGLDDDLAEALSLAHDLGHTPFGHAGEEALDACMRDHGGFDHNAQALRIVTTLERHYAEFDGLNLTWETLEGLVKHNGPLRGPDVHETILAYTARNDLELGTYAGLEAQVAALADDIAYNNHDIDDGLRADLFAVSDLADLPLVGPVFHEVARRYPGIERPRLIHESIRRLINLMVSDLMVETRRRLEEAKPRTVEDIRAQRRPMVAFSAEMETHNRALKAFLFKRMYRHERVNQMTDHAREVVRDLFLVYMGDPPPPVLRQAAGGDLRARARAVADYIAGMTDRFALDEHKRLCAPKEE
ncbi:MAG: deoxyguanosinetriphosphate triphosphohydrolase [Alphaproteobacteria bacterium]